MERVLRSKHKARQNYNAISRWYDLFTGSEKKFTDIGIQMLDAQENESILEIGSGTGHALIEFVKKGGNVFAIDLSEKMLKVSRRKHRAGNAALCQADGLFIPFTNNSFDAIFISFTLELFDTPDIPIVLSECHRVLKAGGRIGVVALAKQELSAVRIYEWFHQILPNLVDCRPIHLPDIFSKSEFIIRKSIIRTMWGLPVNLVTALPRKTAQGSQPDILLPS